MAKKIDSDISDLFFNRDFDHCRILDKKGQFIEFSGEGLREEATLFLASLERLGVEVPTVDELIEDFLARI